MAGPAPTAARRSCANHPDRPAHAVCMACRKAVCGECATEWDGINYCVACLAAQRKASRKGASRLGWLALIPASVALFALSVWLMAWLGGFAASL